MPHNEPTYDPTDAGNKPGEGPLHVGGEQVSGTTTDPNLPSTRSPASAAQVPQTVLTRDLSEGQEVVQGNGQTYLPRAPGEDQDNYNDRLWRSVFFNAFGRTVEGLTGLIFRKDPKLGEDVPEQIVDAWENVDLAGTSGDVFLRDLEADALTVGHAAILVDFPDTAGEAPNREVEQATLRPYFVPIRKEDIISWRTIILNGVTTLQQVVLEERVEAPVGEYGVKQIVVYRVIWRDGAGVHWKVVRISNQRSIIPIAEGDYPTQVEIPVSEVPTSGRKELFVSRPPLVDVAYLNVAHYQMWSDYAWSIHKTNVPIFVVTGESNLDDEGNTVVMILGGNNALWLPDPAAKAQYVSHSGAALGASKTALDDLKSEMGTLGLAMLSPQKRSAETAEAKRLDKSTSDSSLSVAARGLQDAVERAFGFWARYLGMTDEGAGGSIEINRDFEGLLMDAPVMTAYAALVNAGFPERVVLEALQRGGRISEDADLEELEMEMAAARVQEADAQIPEPPAPRGAVAIEFGEDGRPSRLVPEGS